MRKPGFTNRNLIFNFLMSGNFKHLIPFAGYQLLQEFSFFPQKYYIAVSKNRMSHKSCGYTFYRYLINLMKLFTKSWFFICINAFQRNGRNHALNIVKIKRNYYDFILNLTIPANLHPSTQIDIYCQFYISENYFGEAIDTQCKVTTRMCLH